jgi:hypothetical protein
VLVAAVSLGAAACNDNTTNFVHVVAVATVRFVNATDVPITVANGGLVDTFNISLGFGRQSGCFLVDLSSGTTVPLTFTNATTGTVITGFDIALAVGSNVTIVAFADTTGVVQFAALTNRFSPAAGNAGLRFFNAAQPAGALIMQGNGIALTPFIGFGAPSAFANVLGGLTAVTFTNGTSTVLDAGTMTFTAGQNSTIVVGPAAGGATTPLRFFTTTGC